MNEKTAAIESDQRLSLPQFVKLVKTATPDTLKRLDRNRLPRHIPEELVEHAPEGSKSIVEELMFDISMQNIDVQNELSDIFGQGIHAVLSESQKRGDSEALRWFKSKVRKLANLFDENKLRPTKKNLIKFDELNQALRDRYNDLQMEYIHLSGLREVAESKQQEADIVHKDLLDDPIQVLSQRMQSIQHATDIYMYVNMIAATKEMEYLIACMRAQDELNRRVMSQVEAERFRLEDLVTNMVTRYTKKSEIEALKHSITQRLEKCRIHEIVLDEDDLTRWLDTIVEASLSKFVSQKARKSLNESKNNLYHLMQRYCELQEQGASQIAQNPFSQVDPQEAITYLIKSEEFILMYFREKRAELSLWVGTAADFRLKGLKNLERNLLKELRKNYKLRR
ncbi:MAG: hypothetical protein ACQES2_06425 [Pseudomonadota bacterium]